MAQPIDLYYWPTPNGWKITIFLEEAGLPYHLVPVDITSGDQYESEFLKISPNNKIPAIVDPEGPDGEPISLSESGAILIYLADKTGEFLPEAPRDRYVVLQWLMFQMGHVGPMLGQAHHFRGYAPEKIPYAIERYTDEAARLYGVMDRRLSEAEYFAGKEYTLADMAIYPGSSRTRGRARIWETTLTSNAGTMPLSRAPPSAARWRSARSYAARWTRLTTMPAGRSSEAARRGARTALVLTHCGAISDGEQGRSPDDRGDGGQAKPGNEERRAEAERRG